jgi:hypothetical protein
VELQALSVPDVDWTLELDDPGVPPPGDDDTLWSLRIWHRMRTVFRSFSHTDEGARLAVIAVTPGLGGIGTSAAGAAGSDASASVGGAVFEVEASAMPCSREIVLSRMLGLGLSGFTSSIKARKVCNTME